MPMNRRYRTKSPHGRVRPRFQLREDCVFFIEEGGLSRRPIRIPALVTKDPLISFKGYNKKKPNATYYSGDRISSASRAKHDPFHRCMKKYLCHALLCARKQIYSRQPDRNDVMQASKIESLIAQIINDRKDLRLFIVHD
jgi:hypothetical protein